MRAPLPSRAPSGGSPRNCIPTPTSTIRRRPRASPSSMPPTRSSATRRSARLSTAARSTPKASRAFRASKVSAARPARRLRPRRDFETFTWGPGGFQRERPRRAVGGFGGFDDIIKEMFGGGRRGGGRAVAATFEQEDFGELGQRCQRALTITLPEAAKGTTRRVHLPTGKELDVKIPGRPRRRPADPAERPGPRRARRRAGDVLITVSIAPHPRVRARGAPTCGSNCRSRSTKRCSAPRCACRRSMARSNSRSRRAPTADARSASRARASRPRTAPAISSPPCASCCPSARMPSSMS